MTKDEAIDSLNELIEICRNGEYGYRTAAEHVNNSELATVFEEYASQRSGFAKALQAQVDHLSEQPVEGGTIAGAIHRGWIDLKSIFTGGDAGAIVAACESGEETAVAAYDRVAEYTDLTGEARSLVDKQYRSVKEAHQRMVHLREKIRDGAEYPKT